MIRSDYDNSGTGFIELQSLEPENGSSGFGGFPDWDETGNVLSHKHLQSRLGTRSRAKLICQCLCCSSALAMIIATLVYYSQCWTSTDEYNLLQQLELLQVHQVVPLAKAHSHNDYLQARPLSEALAEGFCSVEADVFFEDGDLFIGHAIPSAETLEELYLKPLVQRATKAPATASGSITLQPIYPSSRLLGIQGCEQLTLLVDLKHIPGFGSPPLETWKELERQIEEVNTRHGMDIFQCYEPSGAPVEHAQQSAVKVVATGIAASDLEELATHMVQSEKRCSTLDGRSLDVSAALGKVQSMVSHDWFDGFSSKTTAELKAYVDRAHAQNFRVRFWDTPDGIDTWDKLVDIGVDLISTDILGLLRLYLTGFPNKECPNTTIPFNTHGSNASDLVV